ncbi:hypothetical protein DQ04_01301110 [Trypanosoma grayi]|uniref:hypothetical protein n=1 Tax=Trypanosoma grayi TaxID=71804 RepID=UPI0004F40270|nr:hypothetical protein DQ04_01301110 [Trypanosoma grayi]KEG12967.1 hypothetical protein DQ04_01301110 [Trypanosoma grayi]
MWRTVETKQQPSRRRRESTAVTRRNPAAVASSRTPPASTQTVAALVRSLRRASQSLRASAFVRRDVLLPVRQYLSAHAKDSLTGVHLVALGIGPFSREESRSGFLQMALLLAVRSECESILRRPAASLAASAASTGIADVDAEAGTTDLSQNAPPALTTTFFDPVTNELHARCCEQLGVRMEEQNRYGAYTPAGPHAVLIAYLPHSPWALLRNLFVSNAMPGADSASENQLQRLRCTLVIGNDVREKLTPSSDIMAILTPYLHFHEVKALSGNNDAYNGVAAHGDCNDDDYDGMEDADDHLPSGPRGVNRHDILRAFSDTAVMYLNTEREAELSDALRRVRLPRLTRGGPDIW